MNAQYAAQDVGESGRMWLTDDGRSLDAVLADLELYARRLNAEEEEFERQSLTLSNGCVLVVGALDWSA
jgi:hypothetical protein